MTFNMPRFSDAPRRRLQYLFGAGHVAKTLVWAASELFLSYFVHVHLGVSAEQTGLLIFWSMLYSGALDLTAAACLSFRPGKERLVPGLQTAGALLTSAGVLMLFTPMRFEGSGQLAWLGVATLLFRTGYTVYDVSQNSLVSLLPSDEDEARHYIRLRTTLSYFAKILVASASFFVLGQAGRPLASLAVLLPVCLLVVATALPMGRQIITVTGVRDELLPGKIVSQLSWTLIAVSAHVALLGLVGRFVPFIVEPDSGRSFGAIITLASVCGGMIGPLSVRRERLSPLRLLGLTTVCVVSACWLIGVGDIISAMVAGGLFGIGMGATTAIYWNDVSAVVRGYALTTGIRADLLAFALLTATIKLSVALSGLMFGFLLSGFERHDSAAAHLIGILALAGGTIFFLGMLRSSHPAGAAGAPSANAS
jgi:Na+/melibiose symporter-like transporter